jgi:hypothetical protein
MLLLIMGLMLSCAFGETSHGGSRSKPPPTFGFSTSPNDVNQMLSSLERENESLIPSTLLTPFFKQLEHDIEMNTKKTGLNFGVEYIPLTQHSHFGMPHENAGGAELEVFGRYHPMGHDVMDTTIGFKLEQENRIAKIPPGEFYQQLNSIIATTSGFEKLKAALTELWYEQVIIKDRLIMRAGKINITSVMNNYGFESRKFYFLSDVFTSYPATDEPRRSLGAIVAVKLMPHIYVSGAVGDANGEKETSGFNTIGKGQLFSAIELGYRHIISSPSSDNYHIFIWHTAARPQRGLPSESGYSLVLQKNFAFRFIPFTKFDRNQGKSQAFKQVWIGGFVYHYPFGEKVGLLGVGVGQAKLNKFELEAEPEELFQGGHQTIVEVFYRIQFSPYTQITPDVQLIKTITTEHRPSKWAPVISLRVRTAV